MVTKNATARKASAARKASKASKAPAPAPVAPAPVAPAPAPVANGRPVPTEAERAVLARFLAPSHSRLLPPPGSRMATPVAALAIITAIDANGAPMHANNLKMKAPHGNYSALKAALSAAGLIEPFRGNGLWALTAAGRAAARKGALPDGFGGKAPPAPVAPPAPPAAPAPAPKKPRKASK